MIDRARCWTKHAGVVRIAAWIGVGVLLTGPSGAQTPTPKVFHACYNKGTGTVYRIKEPNTPQACTSSQHVEFSWTDGTAGNDHGALAGLADDDHPQYLLSNGTRALSGSLSVGGFKLSNLGAATANGDALRFEQGVKSGDAAAGDLGGTYPNPFIAALRGSALSATAPSAAGQVLAWNGAAWTPTTPAAGITDHGALTGLSNDDHPQYVLANGVRSTTDGFAVTGTLGIGSIPASGGGVRIMWYAGKAAFRVGEALSSFWDDANVGKWSMATGAGTMASGVGSTAMGTNTHATGVASTAMGSFATASGASSTAIGGNTVASGATSIAMGRLANTNSQDGSFVYGDASSTVYVMSTAPNQFVVRAAGGTILYSNAGLTAGVSLAPGAGAWASVSDVRLKEHFRELDADSVLARIARLAVREWNYKSQDSTVRHVGPTAQDFYAAFKLSASDTTITTTDIDGIALLAIQALERRTAELRERTAQMSALEGRVGELERLLATLLADSTARRPIPQSR